MKIAFGIYEIAFGICEIAFGRSKIVISISKIAFGSVKSAFGTLKITFSTGVFFMNDSQQRKMDKFLREDVFMKDNAADFPADSPGDKTANVFADLITEIQTLAANQISGFDDKRQAFDNVEDARDNLIEDLEQINLAAKAFADEVNGIENKFRMPRKPTNQTLLATARSFAADAVEHQAKFIEYGLPVDFLADLQADIAAFETASASADSAEESHAEATGGLADAFRRGTALSKKLAAIVKIKYRDNAGKLASFVVASHLERAPQRKQITSQPVA